MQVLICLSVFLATAAAECSVPDVTTPLLVSNFSGVWYQYASWGDIVFKGNGDCAKTEYTLDPDTNKLTVNNTELSGSDYSEVDGTAELIDDISQAGVLKVTMQTLSGDQTTDLRVLKTDYDSFAIVYNCKSGFLWDSDASWILTRDRVPEYTVIDAILDAIGDIRAESFDLSIVDYDETYQGDDCEN